MLIVRNTAMKITFTTK